MKIDEAIAILEKRTQSPFVRANTESLDAMKLGIEALKSIKEHRAEFGNIPVINLPGETR